MQPLRDDAVRLGDGRDVGFAEYGVADGRPLVWLPGTPGCRWSFPAPELAAQLGLRVIVVERPGFGRSSPQPGRRIVDFPADLVAVADRLGLDRFPIAGWSGAGPYLLAAGSALRERIERIAMVACIGPLDGAGSERGMALTRRAGLALIRRSPSLAASVASIVLDPRRDVARFYGAMVRGLGEADQRILARPEVWAAQLERVAEALRPGVAGFVEEVAIAARPWGFPLESVHVPVRIWHGSDDRSTPLSMARHVAARLPNAELCVFDGEGHFLVTEHAAKIFSWAGTGA